MADIKMEIAEAQNTKDDVGQGSVSTELLTPEEDKRLLRRIDMCLLPVMALSYLFQFLDKSGLGYSAILGLREDLHLTGEDFSWASSVYYFGYLAASYPISIIMVRWRVAKTIAVAVVIWGTVLMLTAVCTNAGSLMAVRFFLGVAESPIAPGLSVTIAMWYKRSEQPLRHAGWFLGNHLAGLFGGLLAYGIGHVDSIAPWKAVFLVFGGATVAWSVGIFFLLPDVPMDAWFLTKSDRTKAIIRVRENMTGIKSNEFKWHQCREALFDVKAWAVVVLQLCGNIPNGGVQSFGSIVIQGFGYNTFHTLLLQSAAYLAQIFLLLFVTGGSTYFHNKRTYFMALNLALSVVGAALIGQVPADHQWTRYAGYVLTLSFAANFPLIMAMCSGNFGGFTKKTTVNAMQFIAYCAGNIVGPQLFFPREAPEYQSGFLAMMICFGMGIVVVFAFRVYLICENRRRDRLTGDEGLEVEDIHEGLDTMDRTDKEMLRFRYVY